MGMNVFLRSPNEKIDRKYSKKDVNRHLFLDRNYNMFFCFDNEFNELEEQYDIDLSPLKMTNDGGRGEYKLNEKDRKDWELSNCETKEERKRVLEESKERLEKARIEDQEVFENNWCEISLIRSTINSLIDKIKENPSKLDNINFFSYEKENFLMGIDNPQKNIYYIESDFKHILDFCDYVGQKGINKMAFYER